MPTCMLGYVRVHARNSDNACMDSWRVLTPVRRLLGDERAEVSVICLAKWSLTKYQISVQSVQPFLRYGKVARTCARVDIPHPWFMFTAQIIGL